MPRHWILPFALLAIPSFASAADVVITKGENVYEFKIGRETVARYQFAGTVRVEKGDGTKPLAKPFLWPVIAPNGTPVTRAWPMDRNNSDKTDHFHQKSMWFCHGDVIPEGIDLKGRHAVDFWSEFPGHGRIVCVKSANGKAGEIITWNEWQTPEGQNILDEERDISVREVAGGRLFTFVCKLSANVCPITFGDTKEGSFGVRVNDAMRTEIATGGTVTSADGTIAAAPMKDTLPMWGKLADWHDYSGTVNGKQAGIAIFDHPENPSRAAWHTRAYGLMAANPFGRAKSGFPIYKGNTDLVKIEKGKSLTFKYAIFVHDGDVKAGKVAEAYEAFKK
ncbi:MAG TPA: PmoA family protein [Urbifossiella sp.]|jgi:hypothetical protein